MNTHEVIKPSKHNTNDEKDKKTYKMWLLQQNIEGVKGIYFYTNNKCKILQKIISTLVRNFKTNTYIATLV